MCYVGARRFACLCNLVVTIARVWLKYSQCVTVVHFVLLAPAAQTETVAVCQSCFGILTSASDKIKAS